MKVLFVCRGNVGRSQAAAEYFKHLSKGEADSVGTLVDVPGQRIGDRPGAVAIIEAMRQDKIDMSDNKTTQLTQEMIEDYDKIIVMDEPETIPQWLTDSPKTERWEIEDPKGQSLDFAIKVRDQIRHRVEQLLGFPDSL